ncbi:MAG: hypothetical protein JO233_04940 [Candidatus Eremiobacteraeota bacterium]|nr:hypothetical protein [Candidatus Eremiobacteraeota bacterium]
MTRCTARSIGTERINTSIDRASLTVVTATSLEYRIARAELPEVNVINAGIALVALEQRRFSGIAISCGLAGGLQDRWPTGTVIIPDVIRHPSGESVQCDAELVRKLRASAKALGAAYTGEPLLTSSSIVRGDARRTWAKHGFAAVDMESGLLHATRVAAVRVVLDTPQRELNAAWLRPATLIFHPQAWFELPWLAREGPRCARLAARVIRGALG